MAAIKKLIVKKYRSVDQVEVVFPPTTPIVLLGENNAGKSNILAAINIVLGEQWPSTRQLEDSDFYFRNPSTPIFIRCDFESPLAGKYESLEWQCETDVSTQAQSIKFGAYQRGQFYKYISREEREDCLCVLVQAERNLNYQLSYQNKYTMLSKVMHRFHEELRRHAQVRDDLVSHFEEIKRLFDQVPPFREFKDSLKADMADLASNMTHRLDVDLEAYNPVNFFHALRIQAKEGQQVRSFEELGTGEQQVLALSFARAYAKAFHRTVLLAIEEPEVHLHPLAQRWLAQKVYDLTSSGLQIVITTHSPAFLNLQHLDGCVFVQKEPQQGTRTKQLTRAALTDFCVKHGASKNKSRPENIFDFYAASTTESILEGFFARVVVLVEGPTEALALPVYMKALGLDPLKNGIAFVSSGGKGSLAKFWRLYSAYGIPIYIIFDNDAKEDEQGTKRKDALVTLGMSDVDEITKICSGTDIRIESTFAVFGEDFETCLRHQLRELNYEQQEREAREFIGLEPDNTKDCKPLVARRVAETLAPITGSMSLQKNSDEKDDTDQWLGEMWKPFLELKRVLNTMLPQTTAIEQQDASETDATSETDEKDWFPVEEQLEEELPF